MRRGNSTLFFWWGDGRMGDLSRLSAICMETNSFHLWSTVCDGSFCQIFFLLSTFLFCHLICSFFFFFFSFFLSFFLSFFHSFFLSFFRSFFLSLFLSFLLFFLLSLLYSFLISFLPLFYLFTSCIVDPLLMSLPLRWRSTCWTNY